MPIIKGLKWLFGTNERQLFLAFMVMVACTLWSLHRANDYKNQLEAIQLVQKTAKKDQERVIDIPVIHSKIIAGRSNANAPKYKAAVTAAAEQRTRVIVRTQEVQCSTPSLPGTDQAIESIHGSTGSPELVSVTREDWTSITAAAGRAAQMHQESQDWIDLGVAVPLDP